MELRYIIRYQAMATHEYASIPQTRRRIYIVAFADLALSDRFRFPEPIPLTSGTIQWIKLDERKPDILLYRGYAVRQIYARYRYG